jgi:hypothetical protein
MSLLLLQTIILACQIGAPGNGNSYNTHLVFETMAKQQNEQRSCQRRLIVCVKTSKLASKDSALANCLEQTE